MLNEGKTIAEVARSACLTETTWYRWKNTSGGTKGPDIKRLKELEVEWRGGSSPPRSHGTVRESLDSHGS